MEKDNSYTQYDDNSLIVSKDEAPISIEQETKKDEITQDFSNNSHLETQSNTRVQIKNQNENSNNLKIIFEANSNSTLGKKSNTCYNNLLLKPIIRKRLIKAKSIEKRARTYATKINIFLQIFKNTKLKNYTISQYYNFKRKLRNKIFRIFDKKYLIIFEKYLKIQKVDPKDIIDAILQIKHEDKEISKEYCSSRCSKKICLKIFKNNYYTIKIELLKYHIQKLKEENKPFKMKPEVLKYHLKFLEFLAKRRQPIEKEIRAYPKRFLSSCERSNKNQFCDMWNDLDLAKKSSQKNSKASNRNQKTILFQVTYQPFKESSKFI